MSEPRRFHRSPREAMLGGVCAGLARYASLDPTVVRLGTVVLCFFPPLTPAILIAYLVAWIMVPNEPGEDMPESFARREEAKERVVERAKDELGRARRERNGRALLGAVLVVVGLLLLADRFDLFDYWPFAWIRFDTLWPLAIIAVGVVLLMRGLSRRPAGGPEEPGPDSGPPPAPPPPP